MRPVDKQAFEALRLLKANLRTTWADINHKVCAGDYPPDSRGAEEESPSDVWPQPSQER